MIKQFCRIKHDPPNSYGDCLRATVASLLNIEHVEDVPHFYHDNCDGKEGRKRLDAYLEKYHLRSFWSAFDAEASRSDVLNHMKEMNPNVHYMLFGMTEHGTSHVVICMNDEVVHDTSWYPTPIVKADTAWLICLFVPMILVNHK